MSLSLEAKEKKNAYMRQWRANNKGKVKDHNRRYWENKAGQEDSAVECRCLECNKLLGKIRGKDSQFETMCNRCKTVYFCTYDHVEALEAL